MSLSRRRTFGSHQILYNIVPDPSFEYDTLNQAPATWYPFVAINGGVTSLTTFEVQNGWASSGKQSLRVTTTFEGPDASEIIIGTANYDSNGPFTQIPALPNQAYSASAEINVLSIPSAPAIIVLQLAAYGSGGTNTSFLGNSQSINYNFTLGTQVLTLPYFITPPNTAYIVLYVYGPFMAYTQGSGLVDYYLDSLQISPTQYVPTYADGDFFGWHWIGTPGDSISTNGPTSGGPPVVVTQSATTIEATTAILNGTANPEGYSTNAFFDWGTTTAYGNITGNQAQGAGTSALPVNQSITGLTADTVYHFRIGATNTKGTTYGSDSTFTTLTGGAIPQVTTQPATNIEETSVTLNGIINPEGLATNGFFNWGTTTSYGNTTANQAQGSGSSNVSINQALTGLTVDTVYHFRVGATNSQGTTYGADATFTTSSTAPVLAVQTSNGISRLYAGSNPIVFKGVTLWPLPDHVSNYTGTGGAGGTGFASQLYANIETAIQAMAAWDVNVIRLRTLYTDYALGATGPTGLSEAEYIDWIVNIYNICVANGMYLMVCDWMPQDSTGNDGTTNYSGANWAGASHVAYPLFAAIIAALPSAPYLFFEPFNEPYDISWTSWQGNMEATLSEFRTTLGWDGLVILDGINYANSGTGGGGYSTEYYTNLVNYDAGLIGNANIAFAKHDYENDGYGGTWSLSGWQSSAGYPSTAYVICETEVGNYNGATPVNAWSEAAINAMVTQPATWASFCGTMAFNGGPWVDANALTTSNYTTASNPWGQYTQAAFTNTGAAPVNTVAPSVTGSTTVGGVLTTTNGTWSNSPSGYAYTWNGTGSPTNESTYTSVTGDVGNDIHSAVTATNNYGSNTANSNSVGPITTGGGGGGLSTPGSWTQVWSAPVSTATTLSELAPYFNSSWLTGPSSPGVGNIEGCGYWGGQAGQMQGPAAIQPGGSNGLLLAALATANATDAAKVPAEYRGGNEYAFITTAGLMSVDPGHSGTGGAPGQNFQGPLVVRYKVKFPTPVDTDLAIWTTSAPNYNNSGGSENEVIELDFTEDLGSFQYHVHPPNNNAGVATTPPGTNLSTWVQTPHTYEWLLQESGITMYLDGASSASWFNPSASGPYAPLANEIAMYIIFASAKNAPLTLYTFDVWTGTP